MNTDADKLRELAEQLDASPDNDVTQRVILELLAITRGMSATLFERMNVGKGA